MRVLLLRHAETDWNRERRFQGRHDVPLSDAGRGQADSAARLLAAFMAMMLPSVVLYPSLVDAATRARR